MSVGSTKKYATRMAQGAISPKMILATLLPLIGGLVAVGVHWIVTGEFSRVELGAALGVGFSAILAAAGAWAGKPGEVIVPMAVTGHPPLAGAQERAGNVLLTVILLVVGIIITVWGVSMLLGATGLLSVLVGVLVAAIGLILIMWAIGHYR